MRFKNLDLGEPETIYVVVDSHEGAAVAYFSHRSDAELFVAAMSTPSYWDIEENLVDEHAHELREGNKPWHVGIKLDGQVYGEPYIVSTIILTERLMPTATPPRLEGTFWAKTSAEAVSMARDKMAELLR